MSRRQSCVTYLSQFSKFHLFIFFTPYFTYLSINLFIFNPQRLCDCIGLAVGNKFPIFPIGFFAFSFQAAHVTRLTWVTLCRSVCISFVSYDV